MSFAPDYTPTKDFSQDEAVNASGRSTVSTSALDAELANVESSVNHINGNLKEIQRDDNELRDFLIKPRMLSDAARALISGGWVPRGEWTSDVAYKLRDFVERNEVCYVCCVAHTSQDFSAEVTFWMGVTSTGDVTALVEQAEAAKQGAESSAQAAVDSASASGINASNAAQSATASANSAVTSTNSALLAGQHKDAAANSANASAASANSALTSKNAAEAFATAAANSAASINPNNLVHRTGDEAISGKKTFTDLPSLPLGDPGTAVYRDIGTGPDQIPDMSAYVTSHGNTGYEILPNGTIRQWGVISSANGTTTSIPFPIVFPNACFRVTATGSNGSGNTQVTVTLNSKSTSVAVVSCFIGAGGAVLNLIQNAGAAQIHWDAVGR